MKSSSIMKVIVCSDMRGRGSRSFHTYSRDSHFCHWLMGAWPFACAPSLDFLFLVVSNEAELAPSVGY